MANSFKFQEKSFMVGDTIDIDYKIKEGEKERIQVFKGIIIKIKGDSLATRMITVRKMSSSGVGIERIIPLSSPNLAKITLIKKSNYQKAKLYFLQGLSDQEMRSKLYRSKKIIKKIKKVEKTPKVAEKK
ncbi:MAG: 50S ribosomal protein L19 [bacterium]|nr:50S ribosomal protein L19 [bacterium]